MSAGTIYTEIDLDYSKFERNQQKLLQSATTTSLSVEKNWQNLGAKSDAIFTASRNSIINSFEMIKNKAGTSAAEIVRAEEAKNAKIKALNEEQFGTQTSLLDSLKSNWLAASAVVATALYGLKKFFDLAQLGAQVKSIEESFATLSKNAGISGDVLISKLKEVTNQTVESSDLMKKANRMMVEGFSAEQIVQVGEAARVAARLMGTDVASAYDHVSDAIVNLRQRGLKTAGFVIDLNEAYQKHADRLGIATSSLNDYGKVMALQEAVEARRLEMMKQMGPLQQTEYEMIQKHTAAWKEFKEVIGGFALNVWKNFQADLMDMYERSKALVGIFQSAKGTTAPTTVEEQKIFTGPSGIVANKTEQQQMMDATVMAKQRLELSKQMLQVGTQTLESKIAELAIDEKLALSELAKYGNTGALVEQTKRLFDARAAFLIQQEHINNLTENAAKMAQAEEDAEKTRQDIDKTFLTWKISYLEKEFSTKLKLLQVDTESQKLEQDRIAKLGTAQTGTAVALGYMRPGQAALQNIGFQQADIAGQISAYEREKTITQEIIDTYAKEGIPLADIETRKGRIRSIDNEIYKLETQSLVLGEQKKLQVAELAPAYEGLAAGFRKYVEEQGTLYTQLENMTHDLASGMQGSFSNFFQSIFDNTKSWKDKMAGLFKDLASSFIKALSDMAAKALVTNLNPSGTGAGSGLWSGLLGAIFGSGGGGGGGVTGIESAGLMMQEGGSFWANQPTRLTVGEGGEREFVSVTPESKMKESQPGTNANIFYIQAMDPLSFREFVRKNPEAIIEVTAKDARGAGAMRGVIKGVG